MLEISNLHLGLGKQTLSSFTPENLAPHMPHIKTIIELSVAEYVKVLAPLNNILFQKGGSDEITFGDRALWGGAIFISRSGCFWFNMGER